MRLLTVNIQNGGGTRVERVAAFLDSIEDGEVELTLQQVMDRVLETAGEQLLLQIHRKKSRTGIDYL